MSLEDLGGRARHTPPPPKGPDSFVSTYKIFETQAPLESTPPTRLKFPWEILDPLLHVQNEYQRHLNVNICKDTPALSRPNPM